MRDESRAPLFRFDPGWPFVIAGLLLLAAGILIPGHRELLELRGELLRQETREQVAFEHLRAYDEFLAGVRDSDPEVIRRLAMAHLNKIPAGEESLLLTPGMNQTVGEWVESSVPDRTVVVPPYPDTVLARWALGPGRLWLLGMAVALLFAGFVLGPSTPRIAALAAASAWRRPEAVAATADAAHPDLDEGIASGPDPEPGSDPTSEAVVEIDAADEDGGTTEEASDPEPSLDPSHSFDLIEAKDRPNPMFSEVTGSDADAVEMSASELELWRASETGGDWSVAEYVDRLPPEESIASCDDVTLAFLDESDGRFEDGTGRGSD